jgi:hypothetical protein
MESENSTQACAEVNSESGLTIDKLESDILLYFSRGADMAYAPELYSGNALDRKYTLDEARRLCALGERFKYEMMAKLKQHKWKDDAEFETFMSNQQYMLSQHFLLTRAGFKNTQRIVDESDVLGDEDFKEYFHIYTFYGDPNQCPVTFDKKTKKIVKKKDL